MDLKLNEDINCPEVESGDIIGYRNDIGIFSWHIITSEKVWSKSGLNGISIDGNGGLSDPQGAIEDGRGTLYKASEYELVLRRKEG